MAAHDNESLAGAIVELTSPDGKTYRFSYAAVIPYAQEDYVVLMELEGDEKGDDQLLITRLIETPEGELSFVVVEEDDIITAVFDKYVAQSLTDVLAEDDTFDADEDGDDCGCGHTH